MTQQRRELRQFGLLVGGLFLAIGAWWLYRNRFPLLAPAIAATGALLVLLGVAYPAALAWPYRLWMGLAAVMGAVMTRVILAIIFFGVVTPIGLLLRLTGHDVMDRRGRDRESYWTDYPSERRKHRHYQKLF